MDIKQEFREAKNMDVYAMNVNDGSFSNVYVKWLEAKINYTHCCKSDIELLHTEVFNLANKLAINGYGNEALRMHLICNGM